eukprot:1157217-Pelagomonas_calceolata.AAC.2
MERLPEIGKQFAPAPLQLMSILQTFSCSLAPNECICCSHSQTRRDSTLLVPEMERLTDTGMFAPVPMPIKPMNILPKRPISAASNRSSTSARRRALRAASPVLSMCCVRYALCLSCYAVDRGNTHACELLWLRPVWCEEQREKQA